MRRQDRFKDRRANGVAAAGDVERKLGGEGPDAGGAGALPLGPEEAEVDAVVVGAAGRRGVGMCHGRFLLLVILPVRRPGRALSKPKTSW